MAPVVSLFLGDSTQLMSQGLRPREGEEIPASMKVVGTLRADACVTDPPYGFDFAGEKDWDSFADQRSFADATDDSKKFMVFCRDWAYACRLNVLRKGAHLAAFTALRTIGPLHFGLMFAGFEIPRVMMWLYGRGQVKQKNDLAPGGEPIFIGRVPCEDMLKLFAKEGRGQLQGQALAAEDGRHPGDVILDDSLVSGAEEIAEYVAEHPGTYFVSKPSQKERDAFCGDPEAGGLPLQKKDNRLSHMTANYRGKVVKDVMAQNVHPTVKSIDLMRRIVRTVSRPGHTIIDPFMGSGTTGVAAVLEGRNFIGIERDPEYFKICEARIENAQAEAAEAVA